MLANRIAGLAAELLPHGRREGHEWRCGSLAGEAGGSLGVHLAGGKAGIWCDFSTGECGDALDLVAQVLFRGEKREALAWSRAWLGLEGADPAVLAQRAERAQAQAKRRDEAAAEQAARRSASAFRLWLGAEERIAGTPVDAYLRGRHIALDELGRQPRALRYHPRLWHEPSQRHWPAMVAAVTDINGHTIAVHRTYLQTHQDGRVTKAPVEPQKMVLGGYRGGCIRLWRGASGKPLAKAPAGETVDICEGIEDALSVALAMPEARVIAAVSVSNMSTIELPAAIGAVRLWRQNDTEPQAVAAFDRAAESFLRSGRRVLVPELPRDVHDANELLQDAA